MSAAARLATSSGQHFNAGTLPLYFTGNLESRLVLVHLNPKQADSADPWSGGPIPGVEEYLADHASFGRLMYGPASGRRHRSAFDHKQIRFLRPFGVIEFLDEDQPDARFQNLERVIDQKLQLEVIPYGSDKFRTAGMTSELLAPHPCLGQTAGHDRHPRAVGRPVLRRCARPTPAAIRHQGTPVPLA